MLALTNSPKARQGSRATRTAARLGRSLAAMPAIERLIAALAWGVSTLLLVVVFAAFAEAADQRLTWIEPTQNEDGTALTDLSHYELHHGCAQPGSYDTVVNIAAPSTSHTVVGLPDGATCYFAMRAVNNAGEKSRWSGEAAHNLPAQLPGPVRNLVAVAVESTATPWVTQPPPGTPLDPAHPLVGNLVCAFNLPDLTDLAGACGAIVNNGMSVANNNAASAPFASLQNIQGLRASSGSHHLRTTNALDTTAATHRGTIILVVTPDTSPGGWRLFGQNGNFEGWLADPRTQFGHNVLNVSPSPMGPSHLGATSVQIYTWDKSGGTTASQIYVNGALAASGTSAASTGGVSPLYIAARPGDTNNAARGIYHSWFWLDVVVTPQQAAALSSNLWQLFQPQ